MGGSQAKPEAILSPVRHTGSHREVVINVSYYDNHSKKIKQVKSGLRVNRKGNISRPQRRKPSHDNGTS